MYNKQLVRSIFIVAMVLLVPGDTWSANSNVSVGKKILVEGDGEKAVRHSKVLLH